VLQREEGRARPRAEGQRRTGAGQIEEQRTAGRGAKALTGRAGFSLFEFFREILRELFVDLGANWKIKLAILREIQGIGARKFVEM
jgi:hypothetical protein